MIKLKNLKQDATNYYLFIDLLMVGLVLINLSWIIFDWVFTVPWVQDLLTWVYGPFVVFYADQVHSNFYNYDLVFVSIFITEFVFGWCVAIFKRQYKSWWHYPIFHWYDLLGCIPVGSFRFLRVLRLISILVRLQRLGVIDLSNTAVFKFLKRYYGIFVEEVSDRVVVNVLNGVQDEIQHGNEFQDRLIKDVLQPRHAVLADEIVSRAEQTTQVLLAKHRDTVRDYIHGVIAQAMSHNPELKLVGHVPVLGGLVNRQLDHAVGDIVANVVEQMVQDLSSETVHGMVKNVTEEILNNLSTQPSTGSVDALAVANEVIELVKQQVQVQRWRELDDRNDALKSGVLQGGEGSSEA